MRAIMLCIALSVLITSSGAPVSVFAAEHVESKAVLITGASSGIGRNTAERLAAEGYFVYAGARKDGDIAELNRIDNVKAVRLDVTRQNEIDAAVEMIEAEGRGLWGIVNNAGVNVIDPLIEADESDLDFLFDVNVYGVYRVTRAFAPMVVESRGRIVNISSISGVLSGGLYGYGMYSMSKHAIEAFTDQLAFEMADLGVKVSGIEPGGFRSEIGMSRCKRMIAESDSKRYEYFAEIMQSYLNSCEKRVAENIAAPAPPPDRVSAAIQHALFDDSPKDHYLVVPQQFEAEITIRKAFEELLNLNRDHEFSYSREQLIALLDDELAILKGEKSREWDTED